MCFRARKLRSDAHTVTPVVIGRRCVRLRFTMEKIVTVNLVRRLLCKSASRHRSTHDFVIQGCGLGHLFTDLAAQRVTVLKQPIPCRSLRGRERQFPGANHQYRSARCPEGGMSQVGGSAVLTSCH
jgi:hypothetical protein